MSWYHEKDLMWVFERGEGLCVSAFFVMAGIFMAQTVDSIDMKNAVKAFSLYTKKRFFRLYEPIILVTVLFLIEVRFVQHNIGIKEFPLYWTSFLMIANINGILGNNIVWFAVALFWCSLPLSAFLFVKKDWSIRLIFPLVFFFGFSFLYNRYGHLCIHSEPLINDWISSGLVKCSVELVFGIELFYFYKLFKKFCVKKV